MKFSRKLNDEERLEVARYYAKNESTVRRTAEQFHISKSTVHTILIETIKFKKAFEPELVKNIQNIIDKNKKERTIRGGNATKKMFEEKRKCK